MHAVSLVDFHGPSGLTLGEAPEPPLGPDDVAITVHASGANFVEALFSRGFVNIDLPWVPGIEAAGVVRAIGSRVTGIEIGERVAALTINRGGGYGGVAVTRADLVHRLPDNLDLVQAAAIPANTTTAFALDGEVAHFGPGQRVLVLAAVGGVGSQIGQVARLRGVDTLVGVVGNEGKRAVALDLGYDEVWLRSELPERTGEEGCDIVVDPVGGDSRVAALELLRFGGRLLTVGNASQAEPVLVDSTRLWLTGTGVSGFNVGALCALHPEKARTYLRTAIDAVASGEVRVHIEGTAPLAEAATVLSRIEAGQTTGKWVLLHPIG